MAKRKRYEAAVVEKPHFEPQLVKFLPQKDLFRVDEVAMYFDVDERCIRNWCEHGILFREKIGGCVRIPRQSILDCRFTKKVRTE